VTYFVKSKGLIKGTVEVGTHDTAVALALTLKASGYAVEMWAERWTDE
jgi:hypothetical protein